MYVLCCTLGTHNITLAYVQTYFRLMSPHTIQRGSFLFLTLYVNLETLDWSDVSTALREAVLVVLQAVVTYAQGVFWAAAMCWSGVHVFLFMCTPTHRLTWCIDVYEFLCGHKTPWMNRMMAAFILLCVLVVITVWTIDRPVSNRLVWPNNQCDGVTVSLLTDKLLPQWVILCLFQPQNPKITYCLSPCFPRHHDLPSWMGYYCSVDQFRLCRQGWVLKTHFKNHPDWMIMWSASIFFLLLVLFLNIYCEIHKRTGSKLSCLWSRFLDFHYV